MRFFTMYISFTLFLACWHPYAKNLAVGSGFPPCKTEEEHLFAANMAYFDIIQYLTNQVHEDTYPLLFLPHHTTYSSSKMMS